MKAEESINILKNPNEEYHSKDGTVGYTFYPNRKNFEAFQLAIQALEQWQELKETITELRDSGGTGTQQEICGYLVNYMNVLESGGALKQEKQELKQESCEDAISREWLKTAIHNFYCGLKHTPTEEDIQAYIDVAPSVKQEPKWNPVSEGLPKEENKSYWICTDYGHQCECRWTNVNPFWTDLTTDWHWHHMDVPSYNKVVAWMPLPEPYKGESEQELKQESVLDKIRTEIENHCGLIKENHCKYCSSCNCLIGVREILETIDKYKESEGEE